MVDKQSENEIKIDKILCRKVFNNKNKFNNTIKLNIFLCLIYYKEFENYKFDFLVF